MLEALYRGYGARIGEVSMIAPFAPYGTDLMPDESVAQCDKRAFCDRDPERLARSVFAFYKWYAASIVWQRPEEWQRGSPKHKRLYREQAEVKKRLLDARLTRRFHTWWRKVNTRNEGTLYASCPDGSDPLLCIDAIDKEWSHHAKAHVATLDPDGAEVIVTLPASSERKEEAVTLSVWLKPERGAWRIDDVARLIVE